MTAESDWINAGAAVASAIAAGASWLAALRSAQAAASANKMTHDARVSGTRSELLVGAVELATRCNKGDRLVTDALESLDRMVTIYSLKPDALATGSQAVEGCRTGFTASNELAQETLRIFRSAKADALDAMNERLVQIKVGLKVCDANLEVIERLHGDYEKSEAQLAARSKFQAFGL